MKQIFFGNVVMKKLLEKMILFFVETKCFKLVTKRLFDAYFGTKPISKMLLQGQKNHVSPYEVDAYTIYKLVGM